MRRFLSIFTAMLCCLMLTMTVSANSASKIENVTYVSTDGSCQVSLTLTVRLDQPVSNLTFPLPINAKNVTMNGSSVRSYQSGDVMMVTLSHLDGLVGDYVMNFQYSVSNTVTVQKDEKTGENKWTLQVPLLSGFAYPIDNLSFTVTLPSESVTDAHFYSGYLQQSVESSLECSTIGKIITGYSKQALNDHETLYLTMQVNREMFPGVTIFQREGNPEIIPMIILTVAALVYWILTMRTAPIIRQRHTNPLEGVTAGEMGSRLTMAGGDLTMMIFTWAQLGYVHIHADKRGRVTLYKRMDMGNERGPYENRCFQNLFGRQDKIDATSNYYAKLCLKAAQTVPGINEMYRPSAGSVKLFRLIACGVQIFCGVCLAMNMVFTPVLQVLLSIILVVLGLITAWNIQEGAYRVHIRGKVPLFVGTGCVFFWVLLGVLAGQVLIASLSALMQIATGFLAAYGGRRSDLGRYSASQVLGLRRYLKHVTNQELRSRVDSNPDFFFDMLPYAIALGVDGHFARQYGRIPLEDCPYLTTERKVKHTPEDWARYMRHVADLMDDRQRKMQAKRSLRINISGK